MSAFARGAAGWLSLSGAIARRAQDRKRREGQQAAEDSKRDRKVNEKQKPEERKP